jgi:phosphoglucomutase/phosphomannomutase
VTGNEIAALVVHQALRGRSTDGPAPLVIQTQVTSGLVRRVAELHGARVVDDLLVGFKYIGEAMDQMAETGTVRGFEAAPLESFAAGVEESHGVLVTPQMRDKDAAGGALLLAELAAHELRRGRTLVDTLDDLQRQTGGVANLLVSAVLQGARGRQTIEQIQDSLRTHPPATIGGYAVERFFDRRDPSGPLGPIRSQTDASSRDVLVFELVNDARVVVRPSGTEPKLKVYVQVAGRVTAPRSVSELDQAVRRLADDFVLFALERGGLSLPHWALRIHGLVNTEDKIWFAQTLLPELIERIERGDDPAARERWVDIQLTRFGADARGLFVPGLAAWSRISTQPHVMAVLAHFRK